ncbi:MAG TPA: hypothetical protein VF764_05235 [Steroidobacteraceae bacterium]
MIQTRLMNVVGDPTNGGTIAPPAFVTIPWAEWLEYLQTVNPPDAQAAGPQLLKKGAKTHE